MLTARMKPTAFENACLCLLSLLHIDCKLSDEWLNAHAHVLIPGMVRHLNYSLGPKIVQPRQLRPELAYPSVRWVIAAGDYAVPHLLQGLVATIRPSWSAKNAHKQSLSLYCLTEIYGGGELGREMARHRIVSYSRKLKDEEAKAMLQILQIWKQNPLGRSKSNWFAQIAVWLLFRATIGILRI